MYNGSKNGTIYDRFKFLVSDERSEEEIFGFLRNVISRHNNDLAEISIGTNGGNKEIEGILLFDNEDFKHFYLRTKGLEDEHFSEGKVLPGARGCDYLLPILYQSEDLRKIRIVQSIFKQP